jgi:hypothetical protein
LTKERVAQVEKWIWILLYGGLLTLVIGLALESRDPAIGWTLISGGGAAALGGLVLIYVRSRMRSE